MTAKIRQISPGIYRLRASCGHMVVLNITAVEHVTAQRHWARAATEEPCAACIIFLDADGKGGIGQWQQWKEAA